MQHMMSAIAHDVDTKDVWYVDLGASNHMMHHKNWFNKLHTPKKPRFVEIGDDMLHPIEHVGEETLVHA